MAQAKIPIELPDDWYDKVAEKLIEKGDFVLVTRCKDCKHRYIPTRCALWYARVDDKEYFVERGDDFYCAFAEPKEIEGGVGNE